MRRARELREKEGRDRSMERQNDLVKSMKLKDRRIEEQQRLQKDKVSIGPEYWPFASPPYYFFVHIEVSCTSTYAPKKRHVHTYAAYYFFVHF